MYHIVSYDQAWCKHRNLRHVSLLVVLLLELLVHVQVGYNGTLTAMETERSDIEESDTWLEYFIHVGVSVWVTPWSTLWILYFYSCLFTILPDGEIVPVDLRCWFAEPNLSACFISLEHVNAVPMLYYCHMSGFELPASSVITGIDIWVLGVVWVLASVQFSDKTFVNGFAGA